MCKLPCLLGLVLFSLVAAHAQSTLYEGLRMNSAVLKKNVRYSVYLPEGYTPSERRYPVVFLLHGFTDDDSGWLQFGECQPILDDAIRSGKIPPMIVVMPDGEKTWYMNHGLGLHRYQDMLVQELIPFVDKNYRTRPTREFRGVAGLSMGGYGALQLSMRHPDVFSACAAFSAAVFTESDMTEMDQEQYDEVFGDAFGSGLAGSARLGEAFKAYEPMQVVMSKPADSLRLVRYYIDCGDDDWLSPANALLHIKLKEKEVPHEFRMRNGGHEWEYWRSGLADGLEFIGRGFRR